MKLRTTARKSPKNIGTRKLSVERAARFRFRGDQIEILSKSAHEGVARAPRKSGTTY
jgi:hypothetical protein